MNGAGIVAKSAYGYAKSAQHVGLPHTLFRPLSATAPTPLDPACLLRPVLFISSANPIATAFLKPSGYGKPIRYALVDVRAPTDGSPGGALQPGDYITGSTGTYFVASLTPNEDPMVVECSATISISRPVGDTGSGPQPYGGATVTTDAPVMSGWPASVLRAGRTVAGRADLPGDVPDGGFEALLPAWPGTVVRTSDRVTDDQGRAFTISVAEVSAFGLRLVLVLSVA